MQQLRQVLAHRVVERLGQTGPSWRQGGRNPETSRRPPQANVGRPGAAPWVERSKQHPPAGASKVEGPKLHLNLSRTRSADHPPLPQAREAHPTPSLLPPCPSPPCGRQDPGHPSPRRAHPAGAPQLLPPAADQEGGGGAGACGGRGKAAGETSSLPGGGGAEREGRGDGGAEAAEGGGEKGGGEGGAEGAVGGGVR